MSDYGTMQTRIKNELKRGDLTSEIQDAIISALRFYKKQRFRFNIARATANTADGNEYYALPDDFIELDTMTLTEGQRVEFMEERTHFWIDQNKGTTNYEGEPYVYAVQADQFRLYPTPDATYTMTITYAYELTEPTSDGASTAWFTDGEELIRTHAKVDLLENIVRGQESFIEAQALRRREQETLRQLRTEYKRSQSAGRITPR